MASIETTNQPSDNNGIPQGLRTKLINYANAQLPSSNPHNGSHDKQISNGIVDARTAAIREYDDQLSAYDTAAFTDSRNPVAEAPTQPTSQERIIDGPDGLSYIIQPDGSWREYRNNTPTGQTGDRTWVDTQLKGVQPSEPSGVNLAARLDAYDRLRATRLSPVATEPDDKIQAAEQGANTLAIRRSEALEGRVRARNRLAAARGAIQTMLAEIAKSADPWRIDQAQGALAEAYNQAEERFVGVSLRTKERISDLLSPATEKLRKFADKYEPHAIALKNRVKAEAQRAGLKISEEGSKLLYRSKNGTDSFIATMSEMCIKFLKRKNERARSRVFYRRREWEAALELKRVAGDHPQVANSDQPVL